MKELLTLALTFRGLPLDPADPREPEQECAHPFKHLEQPDLSGRI